MPQPVKRNSGPSVKEESVFGFFPAAKDIRALQSKRREYFDHIVRLHNFIALWHGCGQRYMGIEHTEYR